MTQTVNGDVKITRSVLPEGERGVDVTVKRIAQLAHSKWGSKSGKIRALAMNIVKQARVPEKDYYGEIVAVHNWIKNPANIRYFRDPIGQETLADPEQTAFNFRGGDCLAGHTRLLLQDGTHVSIADVKVGDVILGRKGWTKVTQWWDKGFLPTNRYHVSTGGEIEATDDHRWILSDGTEKLSKQLSIGDSLLEAPAIGGFSGSSLYEAADFYFFGLFLADGWTDEGRLCIAGKDGHPKEHQKKWVEQYATAKGLSSSWHPRYIRVVVPEGHPLRIISNGLKAHEKYIPRQIINGLSKENAGHLINGLFADSHQPKDRRSGRCYSTTSYEMAQQMRLLLRLIGYSCRITRVDDHGGLGLHPIYRVYPRFYRHDKPVLTAVSTAGAQRVYDIETEDHGIYLPDADIVVHNCDDKTTLEIAMLGSLGIKAYPVVVGTEPGRYSHVYLYAEVPPGNHRKAGAVIPLDPIMKDWPAGKEADPNRIKAKKVYDQLGNPLNLSGVSGMDLGAYEVGPSYLDQEDSQAEKLLKPDRYASYIYKDKTVANSVRVSQGMDGIDTLMGGVQRIPPTGDYFTSTSAGDAGTIIEQDGQMVPRGFIRDEPSRSEIMYQHPATKKELGPLGPIFARKASMETGRIPKEGVTPVASLQRIMAKNIPGVAVPTAVGQKRYDLPAVQKELLKDKLIGQKYRTKPLSKQKIVTLNGQKLTDMGRNARPISLGEELACAQMDMQGLADAIQQTAATPRMAAAQEEQRQRVLKALMDKLHKSEQKVLAIQQKIAKKQMGSASKVRSHAVTAGQAMFGRPASPAIPYGTPDNAAIEGFDVGSLLKNPWTYAPIGVVVGIILLRKFMKKKAS